MFEFSYFVFIICLPVMNTVAVLLCELQREELQPDEAGLRPPLELVLHDGGPALSLGPVWVVDVAKFCIRDKSGPDDMDTAHPSHLRQGESSDQV